MLIFRFAGNLRRHFRQITLNVDTPSQGLRLLLAQCPAFKRDFYKTNIRMRVDGSDVAADTLEFHMNRHLENGATVLFVPVIEGAISAAAAVWVMVAVSVASVAYSLYMTSTMKTKTSAESAETNSLTNNSFTSAENRVGQGRPVPLLLGEMVVGSNVISLGIDTSNNQDWNISIS
ncbi:tail assembly protein [Nissabacter archeti]|uniref:Tail assembly protein n=1 Tax=Nissabacter archeti TaxID=1917880 RepID=A0ABS5JCJ9_9GAMM|nr:tail assembly protein [Nissabacter archeti]MBS0967676.1 tail assembly protein [Nissabacter archeti]